MEKLKVACQPNRRDSALVSTGDERSRDARGNGAPERLYTNTVLLISRYFGVAFTVKPG